MRDQRCVDKEVWEGYTMEVAWHPCFPMVIESSVMSEMFGRAASVLPPELERNEVQPAVKILRLTGATIFG